MKTVIAFGTFDHFHAGHMSYLAQAKALGDLLVVVIARDTTVKQLKGKAADFSEQKRLKLVRNSAVADTVVLGEHGDKYAVLRKYRPDIIALGYDQHAFTQKLKTFIIAQKMNTKIVRLHAYQPEVHKSSIVRMSKSLQKVEKDIIQSYADSRAPAPSL